MVPDRTASEDRTKADARTATEMLHRHSNIKAGGVRTRFLPAASKVDPPCSFLVEVALLLLHFHSSPRIMRLQRVEEAGAMALHDGAGETTVSKGALLRTTTKPQGAAHAGEVEDKARVRLGGTVSRDGSAKAERKVVHVARDNGDSGRTTSGGRTGDD